MEIVIVVQGGLVQYVYSNVAASISLIDLDTDDPNEYDENAAALDVVANDPAFKTVY